MTGALGQVATREFANGTQQRDRDVTAWQQLVFRESVADDAQPELITGQPDPAMERRRGQSVLGGPFARVAQIRGTQHRAECGIGHDGIGVQCARQRQDPAQAVIARWVLAANADIDAICTGVQRERCRGGDGDDDDVARDALA